MTHFSKTFLASVLSVFLAAPLLAMQGEEIRNESSKASQSRMTFQDQTEIEFLPNGRVHILNSGEDMNFSADNKHVFKNDRGEQVIEYSGLATDANAVRSWAIATFAPQGESDPHSHWERDEDYYITSPKAKALVVVDGQKHLLTTGGYLRIGRNQVHQVINLSKSKPLDLVVKCAPSWIYTDVHGVEKK